jgi:hypothetical protein
MLRELLHIAQRVRSQTLGGNHRLRLRDVYALNYRLAKELLGRFPDARIMIGDRVGERGPVQHHWIEIPSLGVFIDPACDALDSFQPARVGKTGQEEFLSVYRNGVDANIDVANPRNRPEVLFKVKSAFDSEA